jgi:hypothetical protein
MIFTHSLAWGLPGGNLAKVWTWPSKIVQTAIEVFQQRGTCLPTQIPFFGSGFGGHEYNFVPSDPVRPVSSVFNGRAVIRFSIGKKYASQCIAVYEVNSENCSLTEIECGTAWVQLEIEGDSAAIEEEITLSFPTNGIFKVCVFRADGMYCREMVAYWFDVKGAPPKHNRSPLDYVPPNRRIALIQGLNFDPPSQFVRSTAKKIRVKLTHKKTSRDDPMKPIFWGFSSLDGHSVSSQSIPTDSDSDCREFSFPHAGIYVLLAGIGIVRGDEIEFKKASRQFYQIEEPGSSIPGTNIRAVQWPSQYKFLPISPKANVGSVTNGISEIRFGLDKKYTHFCVFVREVLGRDKHELSSVETDCMISMAQFKIDRDSERRETKISINYPKNGIFRIEVHRLEGYDWDMLTTYWFEVKGVPT